AVRPGASTARGGSSSRTRTTDDARRVPAGSRTSNVAVRRRWLRRRETGRDAVPSEYGARYLSRGRGQRNGSPRAAPVHARAALRKLGDGIGLEIVRP